MGVNAGISKTEKFETLSLGKNWPMGRHIIK
jgi:hypothetical protein